MSNLKTVYGCLQLFISATFELWSIAHWQSYPIFSMIANQTNSRNRFRVCWIMIITSVTIRNNKRHILLSLKFCCITGENFRFMGVVGNYKELLELHFRKKNT